jgi:cytochrome c oxidase subunit 3
MLCLLFALAGIVMLFVAFTTTYLGHRQDGTWTPLPLPPVLWLDTALLLGASGALEWARRQLRRGDRRGLADALTVAAALGAGFLVGQITAWRALAGQGLYLSGAPHSSFFYLLTGAHGAHLLAGLAALGVIVPRAWRGAYAPPAAGAVTLTAVYWHFLAALWLYVFVILFWL